MSKITDSEASTVFIKALGLFSDVDYANTRIVNDVQYLLRNKYNDLSLAMHELNDGPEELYYPTLMDYMKYCIGNFILGYHAPDVNNVAYDEYCSMVAPLFKPFTKERRTSLFSISRALDPMTKNDPLLGAAYLRYMDTLRKNWYEALKVVEDLDTCDMLQKNYKTLMSYVKVLTVSEWYNKYLYAHVEDFEYYVYNRNKLEYAVFIDPDTVIAIHEDLVELVEQNHDYFYNEQNF